MVASPDYSILKDNRLVAYLWRSQGGVLSRAGAKLAAPIAQVSFADIHVFDAQQIDTIRAIVAASDSFDALTFKLGLEGYDVTEGAVAPHAHLRRF